MTRTLGSVGNVLSLAEVEPFFAIELMFDTRTITFNGEEIEAGPLYFWTGLGDLVIDGTTYTGTGNILGISEVRETADVSAVGATITVTGIPNEILALALSEPYQGRTARIKFGMLNANKELLLLESGDYLLMENGGRFDISVGNPHALADLFVGDMDKMDIVREADSSTIGITIESRLIALDRPALRRYTSEHQKALFSGDLAFDYVNDLQTRELLWGKRAQ